MRVAVVDIGTNSTRLLVADVAPDGTLVELERRAKVTRLGDRLEQTGVLDDRAMERVLATLAEYRTLIDAHGAHPAAAVLTSAVRDAGNGEAFLARVRAQDGALDARVIAGDEEARLTFAAPPASGHGRCDADRRHRRRRGLDRARRGQRPRGDLPRLHAGRRRPSHRAPSRRRPADQGRAERAGRGCPLDLRAGGAPGGSRDASRGHRRGGHGDVPRCDRPRYGVLVGERRPRSRGVGGDAAGASSSAWPDCPKRSGAPCAACTPIAPPPSSPGW